VLKWYSKTAADPVMGGPAPPPIDQNYRAGRGCAKQSASHMGKCHLNPLANPGSPLLITLQND